MILDTAVLNQIQYLTLEVPNNGASWSELWTLSEVLGYLNQRIYRFHFETSLDLTVSTGLPTTIGVSRYDLVAWGLTSFLTFYRVAWIRGSDGYSFELQRQDLFQRDQVDPGWAVTRDTPESYSWNTEPTLTLDLVPAPLVAGTVEIIHDNIDALLTGAGTQVMMPDEFIPFVLWGTLSDMLRKDGPANDFQRAAYAEQRFLEGIELAKLMTKGWL